MKHISRVKSNEKFMLFCFHNKLGGGLTKKMAPKRQTTLHKLVDVILVPILTIRRQLKHNNSSSKKKGNHHIHEPDLWLKSSTTCLHTRSTFAAFYEQQLPLGVWYSGFCFRIFLFTAVDPSSKRLGTSIICIEP